MAIGSGQFATKRHQRITVARGSGVGRNLKLPGNLLEREFTPDLEHEHLALFGGQPAKGGFDRLPPSVVVRGRLKIRSAFIETAVGVLLPCHATRLAPTE